MLLEPTNPLVPASAGFFMANRNTDYREKVERLLKSNMHRKYTRMEIMSATGLDYKHVDYAIEYLFKRGLQGQRKGNVRCYWFEEKPSVATGKRIVSKEKFTGVDWSLSTMRPGCQDAFDHPSRRGDGLHPYRPPYLNSSTNTK